MKILCLDTSSTMCSIALYNNGEITLTETIHPFSSTAILSLITEVLAQSTVTLNQLDAIAFGRGPGSFTGLRIAASITQGMAYALDIPVIPISSLAALAQHAYLKQNFDNFLVATDARLGEIYWGFYRINAKKLVELQGIEALTQPEKILHTENYHGIGNAWQIYSEKMPSPLYTDSQILPSAKAIALLAVEKFLKKEWVTPEKALPVYLRHTVAQKSSK